MVLFEVKKIKLYKMGIGWVSAQSSFSDKEATFPVLAKNQDDFLKTFYVHIIGNSKLLSLSFDSGIREEIQLNYDGDALLSMLEILVGAKSNIVLTSGKEIIGYVAGYQLYNAEEESKKEERVDIIIVSDNNELLHVDINKISSIIPNSDYIRKIIKDELDLLSKSKREDEKNIRLIFDKEEDKTVEVSYLAEMPAWQSTYKLFLLDNEGLLELWAIVNNITPHDWIDAELELVTGKPISFRYDLSTPWFIERPVVQRPEQEQFTVEAPELDYVSAVEEEKAPMAYAAKKRSIAFAEKVPSPSSRVAPIADKGFIPQQALEAAEVVEGTETVSFKIKDLVNVKKGEAAILLLTTRKVPAKKMTIYNEERHPYHPFKAIEIENTADFALEEGPITLYSAKGYLGEAMINRIPKKAKQLITYMLQQDVSVRKDVKTSSEKIGIALSGAYYVETYLTKREYHFEIDNKSAEETELIIEIPKGVFKLDEKQLELEYTRTLNYFRIKIQLKPRSTVKINVPTFRKDSQTIAIDSVSDELIAELLKLNTLTQKQSEILKQLKNLRKEKREKEEMLRKEQEHHNKLIEENQQITQALNVLSDVGDEAKTRAKFVEKLNNIFEAIDLSKKKIEEINEAIISINAKMNELIDKL